jgi:hypothetical protein
VLSDEQTDILAESREDGLRRGIEYLSMLTVDFESLLWQAIGIASKTTAGSLSYGVKVAKTGERTLPGSDLPMPGSGLQGAAVDKAADEASGKIKGFLEKSIDAARVRLAENPWVVRSMRVMGLGLDFFVAALKKALLSREVIATFLPFYDQIKGVVASAAAAEKAIAAGRAVDVVAGAADQVGSGVPAVALRGIQSYLAREKAIQAANAVYTFGKTLATTILQILTAGAATILAVVTKIVELVVSWANKLYMAWTFEAACKKCREWRAEGERGGVEEFGEEFGAICAGCPLIGAFFFSVADYMGTINLTSMFARGSQVLAASSVWAAGSKVYEVQVLACQYLQSIDFKPTFRERSDAERFGYLLRGVAAIAANAKAAPDRKAGKLARAWGAVKSVFS